jgi:8-oxo-dGTP pyrophosphatase MutT (NUDIX family)
MASRPMLHWRSRRAPSPAGRPVESPPTTAGDGRPIPIRGRAEGSRDLTTYLAARLDAHPRPSRPEWDVIPAAVLVPIYEEHGRWSVLYTRRTETVDVHRGQVSFPGGRIDPLDHGPREAALREAEEEVGIPSEQVEILGTLGALLTVTQFEVTPVLGRIAWPCPLRLNTHEVACAFGVPLDWLADPAHLHRQLRMPPIPGREIAVYSFDPYLGETIWGATARITLDLVALWRGFAGAKKKRSGSSPLR